MIDIVFKTKPNHYADEIYFVPSDKEECFLLGLFASKVGKFNIKYDRPLGGPTDFEALVVRKSGLINLFTHITHNWEKYNDAMQQGQAGQVPAEEGQEDEAG